MKNLVKVAYWDTEQRAQPPGLLGEIKGTPTIKAFVPDRKNNRKRPLDYNLAREVKDLERFAVSNMPNFVELVEGSRALSNFMAKADEWGLPKVLVFSKSKTISSTLKALSAEFRRRGSPSRSLPSPFHPAVPFSSRPRSPSPPRVSDGSSLLNCRVDPKTPRL